MSELLFEIFSEEIPAKMQGKALVDMKNIFINHLSKNKIQYKKLETFITPRRVVLFADGLRFSEAENLNQEKRGPKVGANEKALEGFLGSNGLKKEDLFIKDIKGVEYYFANIVKVSGSIDKIISSILEKILYEFPWPKSMRWDSSDIRWIRPIRNILCLFGENVLPIEFGLLKSNNYSFGHRVLAPQKFSVKNFADYKKSLNKQNVILDQSERKKIILKQIDDILSKKNLSLVKDEGLLDEVSGLVEYPVALLGKIEQKFLSLPKEVLYTSIKTHQKYFSIQDKNGKVAPYFITISNNNPSDKSVITEGNERVLKARLYDAEFFFKEDKKISLENRVETLKGVIFHKKLGTVYDKTYRIVSVSEILSKHLGITNSNDVKRGALLSKSDLVTNMVGEFPDLQGVIGKYYAKNDGENSSVSTTISDHYLPRGRSDKCPKLKESSVVSIADKIDSIVGLFHVGEAPSSSKDPYGLRRSALGIIRILIESNFSITVQKLIELSLNSHQVSDAKKVSLLEEVHKFFYERFRYFLKDDFDEYLILAVLNKSEGDIYIDFKKIESLRECLIVPEGKNLSIAAKRVHNILMSCGEEGQDEIQTKLLEGKEEKELFNKLNSLEKSLEKSLKHYEYKQALKDMSSINILIDSFFDKTMIMVDDNRLKNNRIALLRRVNKALCSFVDFSVIEL
ncbi:MAG: glycine--tRNA ligase subunit beta [Alphaproteobacteria bacterium]|nr:glycine--tRNA ligase subunit beta [Alphaproteobacteria bacterium]